MAWSGNHVKRPRTRRTAKPPINGQETRRSRMKRAETQRMTKSDAKRPRTRRTAEPPTKGLEARRSRMKRAVRPRMTKPDAKPSRTRHGIERKTVPRERELLLRTCRPSLKVRPRTRADSAHGSISRRGACPHNGLRVGVLSVAHANERDTFYQRVAPGSLPRWRDGSRHGPPAPSCVATEHISGAAVSTPSMAARVANRSR
jgi:hypothetical protein